MLDWQKLVSQRLSGLALDASEKDEVHAELAAHFEESYESLRTKGLPEQAAVQQTLAQVADWENLRRRIQNAKTKGNIMNSRVKQFWFPSLLTLLLSMGLLALIQIFGPKPWLAGWNGKSLWTLVAPMAMVYVPWCLLLPLVGALGAFLSSLAGGSQRAALSSIIFPVLPYLVFFLIGLPVIAIFNDHLVHNFMFIGFFVGLFAWVLAPGAALLTGALLAQMFLWRRLDSRRIAGS
jgi:hypothetical protein